MSQTIIGTCAFYILLLFLEQYDFLSFHWGEIFSLLLIICSFVIPFEVIIGIFIWIKYRKNISTKKVKNIVLNIASLVVLYITGLYLVFCLNSFTSEGEFINFYHYSNNQGYFIVLGNNTIAISKEQFQEIEKDRYYHIKFRFNNLTHTGTLLTYEGSIYNKSTAG
jgi:hypothetical protein